MEWVKGGSRGACPPGTIDNLVETEIFGEILSHSVKFGRCQEKERERKRERE